MNRKPATPAQRLHKLGACGESIDWIRAEKHRTLGAAWKVCPRGDWLLWLAARAGVDRRVIVRAACECARLSLVHVPAGELRPLRAIETAEAWRDGRTALDEVRADAHAAYAAHAAARADAHAAARADAHAAAHAAHAAAAYAAHAAAHAAYAAHAADARAAAADAAASAAHAAAHAAAAAYAAYAAYAARTRVLAECAEIVRRMVPWSVVARKLRGAR